MLSDTVKKLCLKCGLEFSGENLFCPTDLTQLIPVPGDLAVAGIVGTGYKITGVVAQGAKSVIYKARHETTGQLLALKMIHRQAGPNADKRFAQEAQFLSAFDHPNIVTVLDLGITSKDVPYLVMEYLEGENLSAAIKANGRIEHGRAEGIFIQICSALDYAHNVGMLHRDVKPTNIMLTTAHGRGDFVKVLDFGLAKLLMAEGLDAQKLTAPGELLGSVTYMSPEQCKGETLDARSDIYALGCLMYETLTGSPPFPDKQPFVAMSKHLGEVPALLTTARPDLGLPPELAKIVAKTLEKKRDDRFQTMKDLQQALHRT